jgi:SNF2 family DNA or RNA helicase
MRFVPHDYQALAIEHIKRNPAAALFLDMGLGKTVIALTAVRDLILDSFEATRCLVVAPLRVATQQWPSELAKWDHLADLRMSVVAGDPARRRDALGRDAHVFVVGRDCLAWLEAERPRQKFDMIVLDELSSFKNRRAGRTKAAARLAACARRVVGLTGTPAPNGLMDLWAEYRCIDGGKRLGRFIGPFRDEFFDPDKRCGAQVYSWKPKPGADARISAKVADCTISMRSAGLIDMPVLCVSDFEARMSDSEMRGYRAMRDRLAASVGGAEITAASAGALAAKLLQLANGAAFDGSGGWRELHRRKLDALEEIVEEACGSPLLVAYWFRHDLERIRRRLSEIGADYAEIGSLESVSAWNAGKVRVGLIHPASAGHGLNLQQGGSLMAWFGLTWSQELYSQAIARLWRQGQSSRTVTVRRIVCAGTIDERVTAALGRKSGTQDALIGAVMAEVRDGRG